MLRQSAAVRVREIRAETARRKRIWRLMRAAGYEALRAVRSHVRSRGILNLDWLGRDDDPRVYVYYQVDESQSPVKHFLLGRNGRVLSHSFMDNLYEGYPDLTDKDPEAFKQAAVETLIQNLNSYCQQQREQRRQRSSRRR